MNGANQNREFNIFVPSTFDYESVANLKKALTCALDDQFVSTILFKNSDEGIFCSGMSLDFVANSSKNLDLKSCVDNFKELILLINNSKKPTIAIVNGKVLAGGVGLVAACDFVIADTQSSFCLSEGIYGLAPGIIMPFILQRITMQKLKSLIFTANTLSAHDALQFGLVDFVVHSVTESNKCLKDLLKKLNRISSETIMDTKDLITKTSILHTSEVCELGANLLVNKLNDSKYIEAIKNYSKYGLLPGEK